MEKKVMINHCSLAPRVEVMTLRDPDAGLPIAASTSLSVQPKASAGSCWDKCGGGPRVEGAYARFLKVV